MMDSRDRVESSESYVREDRLFRPRSLRGLVYSPVSQPSLSPLAAFELVKLPDRLVKVLAILATLSLRIIEDAEERTRCSPRLRHGIPGNGSTSFVQTSERRDSRRALSPRGGARIGTLPFVVNSDCDLLIGATAGISLATLVPFIRT